MIRLVKPTMEYKEQILDYKREFLEEGEGSGGLEPFETVEEYLGNVERNSKKETLPEGFVVSSVYLGIDENDKMVGVIKLRHELNDFLRNFGGHIGYAVRKSERCKGYAKEMLRLALLEACALGIDEVLITCDSDNIGSVKTILGNGGVEVKEFEHNGVMIKHFVVGTKTC